MELTVEQIGNTLVLIAGIITSVTLIARSAGKGTQKMLEKALNDEIAPLVASQEQTEKKLDALKVQVDANTLMTSRVDLSNAIKESPKEHQAILHLAECYFLGLRGNSYLFYKFKQWAEQEQVDIGYIIENIDEKKGDLWLTKDNYSKSTGKIS